MGGYHGDLITVSIGLDGMATTTTAEDKGWIRTTLQMKRSSLDVP